MKSLFLLFASSILLLSTTDCSDGQNPQELEGSTAESTTESTAELSGITKAEISSLQWIREEEMLAHDVYEALSEIYTVPVFRNITKSEMVHTTEVAKLLEQFGIEDPAAAHEAGKFSNPEIQSLYNQLIKQGSASYEEAIRVGLQIEDMDIADLEKAVDEEITNEDILFVYNNLLRGSGHHMNAFWFHALKNSIEWEPEHISTERFDEIIKSDTH